MKSIQDVIVTIICTLYKLGCMHREIDMFPQTEAILRYVSANRGIFSICSYRQSGSVIIFSIVSGHVETVALLIRQN